MKHESRSRRRRADRAGRPQSRSRRTRQVLAVARRSARRCTRDRLRLAAHRDRPRRADLPLAGHRRAAPARPGRDRARRYACPGWATSTVENCAAEWRASGDPRRWKRTRGVSATAPIASHLGVFPGIDRRRQRPFACQARGARQIGRSPRPGTGSCQLNIRNHLRALRLGAEQYRDEDRDGGDGGADHHRYREAHVRKGSRAFITLLY